MKKLYSLIRACMTSDMSIFKIKTKKKGKSSSILPAFIALYLMFMVWSSSNGMFESLAPMNLAYLLLSLFVVGISVMTFVEGIYKSGSLMFNCRDDQLLFSLPIKRRTVLFVRVFKFYVFEVLFNSLFLLPIMIAYIRWDSNITWTYYLTSIVMLFFLPIIPIALSTIVGMISSSISSRFKYKNAAQIVVSMLFILVALIFSFKINDIVNYVITHSNDLNESLTKFYYPAGAYAKLVTNFNFIDLLIFIAINLGIFTVTIWVLSKFYFKVNSRMKKVETSNKKINVDEIKIVSQSKTKAIVMKELVTFFKTPVFIINAGFALVLFIIASLVITVKFDSMIAILLSEEYDFGLTKEIIMHNLSIVVLALIVITSFMTSITNSVISLEGRKISILKSLPVKVKTILMGKVLASLVITTPVMFIGDIILFIGLKINIIEAILLLILSIIVPLVSHLIGIIVNLKYPKLDWESTTEVVKQSSSSFIAVMIGMVLVVINAMVIINIVGQVDAIVILIITALVYLLIDGLLYMYLVSKGVKEFNNLTV